MKIELVGFYPFKTRKNKNSPVGTCHIYLCDYDMDIKGILVMKKEKQCFFRFPFSQGIDEETGKKVLYEVISFTDPNKKKQILDFLKKTASKQIFKELNEFKKKNLVEKKE